MSPEPQNQKPPRKSFSILVAVQDNRLGGVPPRLIFQPLGKPLVQIPEDIRKCVAFVGRRNRDGDERIGGTGFFVGVPLPGSTTHAVFFVSAWHVFDGLSKKGGTVYLRVNTTDGKSTSVDVPVTQIVRHDEPNVDMAAFQIQVEPSWDVTFYPIGSLATDDVISEESIGIGDEIFVPGMFAHHKGTERNIPIIRSGHVAAMADEPVWVSWNDGCKIDAYLVDCISTGGLSGSPVFVYLDNMRATKDGTFTLGPGAKYYLLGLIHGHCDAPGASGDLIREERLLNAGVAIVVAARQLKKFFDSPAISAALAKTPRTIGLSAEARTATDSVWRP